MKKIEELKRYYLDHKNVFENSSIFKKQNESLEMFKNEYPIERFSNLSLNEYALGTDNKDSLCYKMEFGTYKHTGPGIGGSTAFKYGIYYSKDKNSFVTRTGIATEPEKTWQSIRDDFLKVLYSVANANSVADIKDDYSSLKGMSMYLIKIAYCYFSEKIVCIAGRKQLKGVLDLFEIQYDDNYSSLQLAFLINKTIRDNIPEIANDSSITIGHLIWDFYYINNESEEREKAKIENKIWIYAPGENANKWDEFYRDGIMALKWDDLGDLRQYASKSEIKEALIEKSNIDSSRKNDVLANWEFVNVLKIGDVVYAKRGTDTIVGKGIVGSDYMFDNNRPEYKSYRKVNWIYNEERNHVELMGNTLVQKTLTDISKYHDYIEKLEKFYGDNKTKEQNSNEYTKFDFLDEVLITEEKYDSIINTLERKKNIILQGVPGVGKTFCAKKIMYSLMNCKDESKIKIVQFHQSYSYEDFIQGYKPNDDGKFEIKNGIFYDLVQEARKEYERAIASNEEPKKYCMIIDEINRGNLSKVFGELMMLIESDKRDSKWSINLTYSDDDFYIPSNLYIIGTMNTADKSTATIDYALRRRFAFIDLEPAFKGEACDKLRKYLVEKEKIDASFVERIITAYKKLNDYIDRELGKEFMIGHSYFINQFNNEENNEIVYSSIVTYEIFPLLEAYFGDNSEKLEEAKKIIEKI